MRIRLIIEIDDGDELVRLLAALAPDARVRVKPMPRPRPSRALSEELNGGRNDRDGANVKIRC
jgi:hypothetical protein